MILLMLSPAWIFSDSGQWIYDHQIGQAFQLPSDLTIQQDGEPNININAEWETKSFEMPPYWSIRNGVWKQSKAWEYELIHLKVYLKDLPTEVQRFSISHGQNLFYVNRAWLVGSLIYRWGVGVTISHPEVTVRHVKTPETGGFGDLGYQISGAATQLSVQYANSFHKKWDGSLEGKLFASYSDIRLEQGTAQVTLFGAQVLAGIRYHFD